MQAVTRSLGGLSFTGLRAQPAAPAGRSAIVSFRPAQARQFFSALVWFIILLLNGLVPSPRQPRQRHGLWIQAARVAGVEIPNAKRIETALTYVYGIGNTTARAIMTETKMENKRTKDLSIDELATLNEEVAKYQVEGDLRRFNNLAIKRLKDIACYRGRRHIMGLPVRGQRTKTNARTRKGKKQTVAGKKKAPTAK